MIVSVMIAMMSRTKKRHVLRRMSSISIDRLFVMKMQEPPTRATLSAPGMNVRAPPLISQLDCVSHPSRYRGSNQFPGTVFRLNFFQSQSSHRATQRPPAYPLCLLYRIMFLQVLLDKNFKHAFETHGLFLPSTLQVLHTPQSIHQVFAHSELKLQTFSRDILRTLSN
jgi:hypothetical protein